ncbi:unnamed protein product [Darwinula stevensoni]|uniref:Uncharacterized protein n=1 Tax=Darwinula stevensoni TaxID=69355 RepID=A0A7R8XEX7_9CRUS|nr:unnamed protein product [Darwinula stevensoni]CAG0894417.1 unnamed protein product [Darwinula stevensoni]
MFRVVPMLLPGNGGRCRKIGPDWLEKGIASDSSSDRWSSIFFLLNCNYQLQMYQESRGRVYARQVGFVIFLYSRGTSQEIIAKKIFFELGGVNAAIRNSLINFAGSDIVNCADSGARWKNSPRNIMSIHCIYVELIRFHDWSFKKERAMRGVFSRDEPQHRGSVQRGYNLAVITDKVHFLKPFSAVVNYTNGLAACKADGADHLVQDDKGVNWHEYTVQYAKSILSMMNPARRGMNHRGRSPVNMRRMERRMGKRKHKTDSSFFETLQES